jgi:hypothetical protein
MAVEGKKFAMKNPAKYGIWNRKTYERECHCALAV